MYLKFMSLSRLLTKKPDAIAVLKGSEQFKTITGTVYLYNTDIGVLMAVEVTGLPVSDEKCSNRFLHFIYTKVKNAAELWKIRFQTQ